jgi:hypothetical protein
MENDKSGQESSPAGRGTLLGVSFTAEQIQALLAKKSAHEEEAIQVCFFLKGRSIDINYYRSS